MPSIITRHSRLTITLTATALVAGFVLMVYELAAARILAPAIGSSTYVWTSVIGVIITALSLGFWTGGRIADARNRLLDIAWLCLLAALAITATLLFYPSVISWAATTFSDQRMAGVASSLLLFAPTSYALGLISPYLAKLNVTSLETSGRTIANLSMFDAIGGISGTFITGFVLFSYIGSRETITLTVLILLVTSWCIVPHRHWTPRLLVTLGILSLAAIPQLTRSSVTEIDTAISHYTISEIPYGGREVRGIASGPGGLQSGINMHNPDELVFWYTRQMADVIAASDSTPKRILILGGGAFTLPKYLAQQYPTTLIDVAEIDPQLLPIARTYFEYDDPDTVSVTTQDARVFVNQSANMYDVILVDVFSDISVPQSLMTKEYGDALDAITAPDGIVIVNSIAGLSGHCSELFDALNAPYAQHFSFSAYRAHHAAARVSNMISVHSRTPLTIDGYTSYIPSIPGYDDNFIPAERLQYTCQQQ